MELYNLSVVNIIPDAHLATIDQVSEFYGEGTGNLTVKLKDASGAIYWGCHWWRKPSDYDFFTKAPPPADIPNAVEAIAALYERAVIDGVPLENLNAALAEKGLSVVEEPQT